MSKRTFLLLSSLIILLTAGAVSAASLKDIAAYPRDKLRELIVPQISKALGREIYVGELRGNLYRTIYLNDVRIAKDKKLSGGALLKAKQVQLEFSLLQTVLSRGNIIPHIRRIRIIEPTVLVERTGKNIWLGIDLDKMAAATNNAAPMPKIDLPKKFELILVNGHGEFIDKWGWHETERIKVPFTRPFHDLNLTATLGKDEKLNYTGTVITLENTIRLGGFVDINHAAFEFWVKAAELDAGTWLTYIIPGDYMLFLGGKTDLDLRMGQRKTPWKRGESQVELYLKGDIRDGIYHLPYLMKAPFKNIYGEIILDTYGVSFKKMKGTAVGMPMAFDGRIQRYENAVISLNITSVSKVDLSKGAELMTALEAFDLTGSGDIAVTFTGPIERSMIKGSVMADQGSIWNIPCKKTTFNFSAYDYVLTFNVPDTSFASGNASIDGTVHFAKNTARINFEGKDLLLAELVPQVPATGSIDISVSANGPLDRYPLDAVITAKTAMLNEQSLGNAQAHLMLVPNALEIKEAHAIMNELPVTFSGRIGIDGSFLIRVPEQQVAVNRIPLWGDLMLSGIVSGDIAGRVRPTGDVQETWKDLRLDLYGDLENTTLLAESFARIKGTVRWDGRSCTLSDLSAAKKGSRLEGSATWNVNGDIAVRVSAGSFADLSEWQTIRSHLPRELKGTVRYRGTFSIQDTVCALEGELAAANIRYGSLALEKIEGALRASNNIVRSDGLTIDLEQDRYLLSGYFDLSPALAGTNNIPLDLSLSIGTEQADLNLLSGFIMNAQQELRSAVIYTNGETSSGSITAGTALALSAPGTESRYWALFNDFSTYGTLLAAFRPYRDHTGGRTEERTDLLSMGTAPTIRGTLSIALHDERPSINALLAVSGIDIGAFACSNGEFSAYTDGGGQIVSSIKAGNGHLLDSSFDSLLLESSFREDQLSFTRTQLVRNEDRLEDFIHGSLPLSAFWDEQKTGLPLDIRVSLPDDHINLLSLFNRNIASIHNDGDLVLHITGSLITPNISAPTIALHDTAITFVTGSVLRSPLIIKELDATLENNTLRIKDILVDWNGPETNNTHNYIGGSGSIAVRTFSFLRPELLEMDCDLTVRDTELSIKMEKLYEGHLFLNNASLKGSYRFPLSKERQAEYYARPVLQELGPTFSADIRAEDGTVYITGTQTTPQYYPLAFDCRISIGRNLEVVRGENLLGAKDLGSLQNALSYFSMSLRERPEKLELYGTLNRPQFTGTVYFEEGTVSFFGRTFTLIDKDTQRSYFGANVGRLQDNRVIFSLDDSASGNATQRFELVAQTTIEIPEQTSVTLAAETGTSSNIQTVTRWYERDYLAIVSGPFDDLSSYTFERYQLTNGIPRPDGEAYVLKDPVSGESLSAERMRELTLDLAPEVFKSAYSSSLYGDAYDNKTIWREMTRSQVNIIARSMLRPLEKNIARRIGLYDIRLKHDFGKDFTQAAGLERQETTLEGEETEETTTEEKEQVAGLDLVAELLQGRLYLTLNSSLDQGLTRKYWNFRFATYRLTWYLWQQVVFDEISLNYTNLFTEDPDLTETLSLEAMHSF